MEIWKDLKDLEYRGPRGGRIQGLTPMTEQERIELELKKSPAKRMQMVRSAEAQEKFERDQLREKNFQGTNRIKRLNAEMNAEIETLKEAKVNTLHILGVQRKYLAQINDLRRQHREGAFVDDEE